jgi:AcrR family transcriptional regulator
MVQETTGTGRRERNRLARHRAYLDVALHIATTEGLDAVTMQRLADELDSAVGTVYTYFPSKGALVAEVQREAIERLAASYLLLRPEVDALVEAERAPEVAALTHLLAIARYWVDLDRTYPEEARLLQLLMSAAELAVPDDDAGRVLPAALRMLDLARDRIARATDAGALSPGDAMERTVTLAASVSGVVQLGRLAHWDADLLDGHRLAATFVDDLLTGWGADLAALAIAHTYVAVLAERGPLARPLHSDDRSTP